MAIRWSAYVAKRPPCNGFGEIRSPSSVSVTAPPSPLISRGQRGQPVGLVTAQVGDPADPGRGVGQGGEGGHDRGELAGVVQVDVEPGDLAAALHGQPGRVEGDVGAHRVEDVAQRVAGLGRALRPARHLHPAAGHERGGEERRRVGQVGLDLDVERVDLARADPPGVRLGVVDLHPGVAQHLDRHRDVRLARHRLARRGARSRPRRTGRRPAAGRRRTGWTSRRRS